MIDWTHGLYYLPRTRPPSFMRDTIRFDYRRHPFHYRRSMAPVERTLTQRVSIGPGQRLRKYTANEKDVRRQAGFSVWSTSSAERVNFSSRRNENHRPLAALIAPITPPRLVVGFSRVQSWIMDRPSVNPWLFKPCHLRMDESWVKRSWPMHNGSETKSHQQTPLQQPQINTPATNSSAKQPSPEVLRTLSGV